MSDDWKITLRASGADYFIFIEMSNIVKGIVDIQPFAKFSFCSAVMKQMQISPNRNGAVDTL